MTPTPEVASVRCRNLALGFALLLLALLMYGLTFLKFGYFASH
jgi:hypothetical protein